MHCGNISYIAGRYSCIAKNSCIARRYSCIAEKKSCIAKKDIHESQKSCIVENHASREYIHALWEVMLREKIFIHHGKVIHCKEEVIHYKRKSMHHGKVMHCGEEVMHCKRISCIAEKCPCIAREEIHASRKEVTHTIAKRRNSCIMHLKRNIYPSTSTVSFCLARVNTKRIIKCDVDINIYPS